MKIRYYLGFLLLTMQLHAAPGDVITEDAATDPDLPRAVVDGDLVVEDADGSNAAIPGLYVEGLATLDGGMLLEGMDIKPLYAVGGAGHSGSYERKIIYDGQDYSDFETGSDHNFGGLSVLTIDRVTGEKLSHIGYATFNGSVGTSGAFDAMAADLNAMEDGSVIVVITSEGAWGFGFESMHEGLLNALYRMGASSQISLHPLSGLYSRYRNYVLIGIPGLGAGNGIESYNEDASGVITNKVAEISTLLIKAGADAKYVPMGLGNSEALNDSGDGVFQRIGIGTNTPSAELDVVGDAKISGNLTVDGIISGNLALAQGSLTTGGLATDSDGDSGIYSTAENTVSIATGGVERVHIDESGDVSIGTNELQATLDVNGNLKVNELVLQEAGGITFADGSVMTQAPEKVVYINQGDDITAILSSEEENVWYQIGPSTHVLTADVLARDGCRYSGAGKDVTIIDGAALSVPVTFVDGRGRGITYFTVESLSATGDLWFSGSGRAEIVIRDCEFSGASVGSDRKTYRIYDSAFTGDGAFSNRIFTGELTIYAYNSTFNSSGSFHIGYTTVHLNAFNCKFSGERVGGESNGMFSPIFANAYNCEFEITNSFGGSNLGVFFTAHNSTITGEGNFTKPESMPAPPNTTFYNCVVNGVLTTKTESNSVIQAASVAIGPHGALTDLQAKQETLQVQGALAIGDYPGGTVPTDVLEISEGAIRYDGQDLKAYVDPGNDGSPGWVSLTSGGDGSAAQTLSINGNQLTISGDESNPVTLPSAANPSAELIMEIVLSGTNLVITEPGNVQSVDLSSLATDAVDDADANATNELITNVSYAAGQLSISDAGNTWDVAINAGSIDAITASDATRVVEVLNNQNARVNGGLEITGAVTMVKQGNISMGDFL
jgi:hypothetical protein